MATEVVLAEYSEKACSSLRLWLDKDPKAFNWSPYVNYMVETVEGGTIQDVEEREKRLRSIVKAVVHCDITQDIPIEKGYEGPYDVVMSILCISNACKSIVGRGPTIACTDGWVYVEYPNLYRAT